MEHGDTIAAISTPPGVGGIAIIRMSGPAAGDILAEVTAAGGRRQYKPRQIYHGWVTEPDGERIDEALIFCMKAPHSYTGEDMAEIQGHGGAAVAQRVLRRVLECGARLAEPGEFSQRAFLNGRIDLAQAESVMSLIGARTESAARIASRHMQGRWSRQVSALYDRILDHLVQVEAAVDFAEEGLLSLDRDSLKSGILGIQAQIGEWLRDADAGLLLMEGMRVVILGRPNVGKSSLLNRFCEEERAIVTEHPGTTRDVLEAEINVKGLLIRLLDTAGLREAGDEAERIGVDRALSWMEKADRILYVLDGSVPLDDLEKKQIAALPAERTVILINKSDISREIESDGIKQMVAGPVFSVSAKLGQGIDEVLSFLYQSALGSGGMEHEVSVIRTRHQTALLRALDSLAAALDATAREDTEELIATDLRGAAMYLGQITGQTVSEDLVERIFARFCVGK